MSERDLEDMEAAERSECDAEIAKETAQREGTTEIRYAYAPHPSEVWLHAYCAVLSAHVTRTGFWDPIIIRNSAAGAAAFGEAAVIRYMGHLYGEKFMAEYEWKHMDKASDMGGDEAAREASAARCRAGDTTQGLSAKDREKIRAGLLAMLADLDAKEGA